jgi:hypothetical protein
MLHKLNGCKNARFEWAMLFKTFSECSQDHFEWLWSQNDLVKVKDQNGTAIIHKVGEQKWRTKFGIKDNNPEVG